MFKKTTFIGGITARCCFATLLLMAFVTLSASSALQAQEHGMGVTKGCNFDVRTCSNTPGTGDQTCTGADECNDAVCDETKPRDVICTFTATNIDGFFDTLTIPAVSGPRTGVFDRVFNDATGGAPPSLSCPTCTGTGFVIDASSITIIDISGDADCPGNVLPCRVGPGINGTPVPTDPNPGAVQFQVIYTPTEADRDNTDGTVANPLIDQAVVLSFDLCDGPLSIPGSNCDTTTESEDDGNTSTSLVDACSVVAKTDSTPCSDNSLDCYDAGCEAGVCVQAHVPVVASTPCDEVSGTECADPGCDGAGACVATHIPKTDSTPCTDDSLDCYDAGCEAGVCVQAHVPVVASTPCDEVNGTECADPGCDGAGACVATHIPKTDSTPCTDDSLDCYDAGCEAGVCVQAHVPVVASTPCDEVSGTECADPGCDGAGACVATHIPKTDSTPCTDDSLDCYDAGCEAGVCVQAHVPVVASTPCDEVSGTECTDPGCDGAGACVATHIPKTDSTPCTDDSLDCYDAGCEAGVCVQAHVPVVASTPCDEVSGTECTDPGCDGAGACVATHIPKTDSTPCTDDSLDCYDAGCEAGVCVQAHVPVVASTPCDEVSGTECTDPGCDGAGACVATHIPKTDSTPCTDDSLDCYDAGCEAGVCVQAHVPVVASTPCDEVSGTECADPGCDGAGACVATHIPKTDSTPCTDDSLDCYDAGCEAGVCVQAHVPVVASTPCDEVSGTECADPGCDGAGACVATHIPKTDSTPCTDDSLDCYDAGCEAGVCVQAHVPVVASTPCDEVSGTECADPGCDGAGACVATHIPKTDSTPCTDDSLDCYDAGCEAGVCVQAHVPVVASTPCDEVSGTECADPGCDGAGACVATHIPKADSTPCGDTGDECFDAGCEAGVCVQEHVPLICENEICRTPGFWGARGGTEKASKSQNITQSVICDGDIDCIIDPVANPPANPLDVCGVQVTNTNLLSDVSAIEAICVAVKGDSKRQLVRQLTAAALNCRLAPCGTVHATLVADCNLVCANEVVSEYNYCIGAIDTFNNGGSNEGTCAISGVPCSDGEDTCTGLGDYCDPYPNCHDEALPCPDGGDVCYQPPGPASSPKKCNAARKNGIFVAPSSP